MPTVPEPVLLRPQFAIPSDWRLDDLHQRLGEIPAERIRLNPPPGYATEDDVLRIHSQEGILCELDDGVLVEKPMVWYEAILAGLIIHKITSFTLAKNLGQVLSSDGILKFLRGKVRIPDVCFISWGRFPKEKLPRRPIPLLIPDLVVEILSDTNTKTEMDHKLRLYFNAGVSLVWYVDPATRTATAYESADQSVLIPVDGGLNGGKILPGFSLSLKQLFDEADRQGPG
ncbi:MAG: Uma2 family endonuclease [Pirellulaceae bacterium]|nr:Uma2 family endonuclease [Planctomycetales bacterium]